MSNNDDLLAKQNELYDDVGVAHQKLYDAIHAVVMQNRQPTPEERKAVQVLGEESRLAWKRLKEHRERVAREWVKPKEGK
jgi:hypothetical protein